MAVLLLYYYCYYLSTPPLLLLLLLLLGLLEMRDFTTLASRACLRTRISQHQEYQYLHQKMDFILVQCSVTQTYKTNITRQ